MTNNDILRRLRYAFDFNDSKMIAIFESGERPASREEISSWLKKEDDADYKNCNDSTMAKFLNGLIAENRGKREGAAPVPESKLTNNIIFMKLKIALDLKAEDVMSILELSGIKISKHELSAFFRRPGHKHYRECKDQILRNFLHGLQLKHKSQQPAAEKKGFSW